MLSWSSLRRRNFGGAVLIASMTLSHGDALGAQSSLTTRDSIVMAREAGVAAASRQGTGGWEVAGLLLPPAIAVAGLAAGTTWDKDRLPVFVAATFAALSIAAVRAPAHTIQDPPPSVIAAAVGDASPAVRDAFVDAYKQRLHLKRRQSVNKSLKFTVPLVLGAAAAFWFLAPALASN